MYHYLTISVIRWLIALSKSDQQGLAFYWSNKLNIITRERGLRCIN